MCAAIQPPRRRSSTHRARHPGLSITSEPAATPEPLGGVPSLMTNSFGYLLALCVTTSLALANGGDDDKKGNNPFQSGQVSWKPGQGVTLADSDEFSMRLAGCMQLQWAFRANDNRPDTINFLLRRATINLTGNAVGRDLTYRLVLEATDDSNVGAAAQTNGPVKDAWVHYVMYKESGSTFAVR